MIAAPMAALLLAAGLATAPAPPIRRLGHHRYRRFGGNAAVALMMGMVATAPILLLSPDVAGAIAAAVAAATVRGRRRRQEAGRRSEAQAMAAALDVLVGELRVGAHPARAFSVAAEESNGAVAQALRTVASGARLGAEVGTGLRTVAAGSSIPAYWDRVGVCWDLAAQHGLAMSTMMRTAQCDMIERQRFADRTQAALAGARATAAILAVLPILGVLLGQLIGAHPVSFLFGGGPGRWLLIAGLALMFIGVAWSDRIIGGVAR